MWPFTRKPKPLNPGPINEDWRVGDLAECLNSDGWVHEDGHSTDGPEKGDTFKVIHVEPGRTAKFGDGWYLQFNSLDGEWNATGFRKVPPLNSAATAEFTAKIRACKPKRVRA